MITRPIILVFSVVAVAAATAFSQNSPVQVADAAEETGPFPLQMLALADGGGETWTPAWPSDFPPDAFSVKKKDALRIELVVESAGTGEADATSPSATARWDGKGRLLEYPFAEAGSFFPVTVQRSRTGRAVGLKFAVNGEETTFSFTYSSDGLVESATLERGSERSFAAFRFRGTQNINGAMFTARGATETRAGEDGVVTAVFDYAFAGGRIIALRKRTETGEDLPLIEMDYDSAGSIVAVRAGPFASEALYDGSGRVAYRRFGETERRFQWDERGLLVREPATDNGDRIEWRYEYSLDARGNWTERRATRWVERFGSIVIDGGNTIRRKIRYR